MSYNITTSDGTVNITIPDGGFDNSTSLTLAGPNAVGYGQYLDQNLLSLLSNFASTISLTTHPAVLVKKTPRVNTIKVYRGGTP